MFERLGEGLFVMIKHTLFELNKRNVQHHKRLKGVFHYNNEEHTKLFDQLNYAYIGGRYCKEKEFLVDMDKIAFWKQETEAFLKLTEEICLERIEGFGYWRNKQNIFMKDSCKEDGIKHFYELFGKLPVFSWQNQKLKGEKDIVKYEFYKKNPTRVLRNTIVLLDQVKGSFHHYYKGKEWIEMLGCLKNSKAHSEENAIEWIKAKGDGIQLSKYGNEYFINGGNHRTCYAKFLGLNELVVGSVEVYELDQKHLNFHAQFSEFGIQIIEWSNNWYILRIDEIAFTIDFKDLSIFISFYKSVKVYIWSIMSDREVKKRILTGTGQVYFNENSKLDCQRLISLYKRNSIRKQKPF